MNVIIMHEAFFYCFSPFFLEIFFPSEPDKKRLSTFNLEYDKSQTIYLPLQIIQGLILQNLFLS